MCSPTASTSLAVRLLLQLVICRLPPFLLVSPLLVASSGSHHHLGTTGGYSPVSAFFSACRSCFLVIARTCLAILRRNDLLFLRSIGQYVNLSPPAVVSPMMIPPFCLLV